MTRNQAVLRALGGKLNLSAFCLAASGAAILQSWLMLMSGMTMFAGLVFWEVHSKRHRIQRRPPRIPDGSSFKNGTIRCAVEAIGAAQKERLDVLDTCPDEIVAMLDGILRTSAEVEGTAIRIARRADHLHGYLVAKELSFVRGTLHNVQQCAAMAKTAHERENYEAAARTYEIEVETLGGLELRIRIALAKLENIRATLAAVPPRIMQMQATNAEMGDASCDCLSDDLLRANDELDEVEQHLHALSQTGDAELGIENDRSPAAPRDLRIARMPGEPDREALELDELYAGEILSSHRFGN